MNRELLLQKIAEINELEIDQVTIIYKRSKGQTLQTSNRTTTFKFTPPLITDKSSNENLDYQQAYLDKKRGSNNLVG